ncbi:hypothetical protein [Falsiroseomonas sp. HW251]|uniref:hypothetical protein n=1 Tax=Falsiroseomonas sp. HW251 TaxID=3390998 RepID=UPI003D310AFD
MTNDYAERRVADRRTRGDPGQGKREPKSVLRDLTITLAVEIDLLAEGIDAVVSIDADGAFVARLVTWAELAGQARTEGVHPTGGMWADRHEELPRAMAGLRWLADQLDEMHRTFERKER